MYCCHVVMFEIDSCNSVHEPYHLEILCWWKTAPLEILRYQSTLWHMSILHKTQLVISIAGFQVCCLNAPSTAILGYAWFLFQEKNRSFLWDRPCRTKRISHIFTPKCGLHPWKVKMVHLKSTQLKREISFWSKPQWIWGSKSKISRGVYHLPLGFHGTGIFIYMNG